MYLIHLKNIFIKKGAVEELEKAGKRPESFALFAYP